MKRLRIAAMVVATTCGLFNSAAYAQRGVGEMTGIGQRAIKPEVISLSGEVQEVVTGPCANTTGRSPRGTHILLKTENEKVLNVHLGPADEVASLATDLEAGIAVTVRAFRTDQMEENHYVAQSLVYADQTVQLRDETLRPVWAGGRGGRNSESGARAGFGLGRGWGAGHGPGRGAGGGYGRQRGRGPAWASSANGQRG